MIRALACIVVTRIGKVLLGLWFLALLIFIAVLTVGLLQGEFLGYLIFVFLPITILLNISIFLAHHVENGSVGIAKITWFVIAAGVLSVALSGFDGKANSDVEIFFTWAMLILTFPVGLAVSAVHYALGAAFAITVETSYLSLVLEWFMCLALGYTQWFILLPWLVRKWKVRRARSTTSSA